MTDLNVLRREYPPCAGSGCLVHDGFYKATHAVLPSIHTEITRLLSTNPTYQVVVTGHSLGAALATLCAADLQLAGFPVELINFGSPRVANAPAAAFISTLLLRKYRITHLNDVIVHTPLASQGYAHIVGEWYDDNRSVRPCQGSEDKDCADQWPWSSLSFEQHLTYLNTSILCTL